MRRPSIFVARVGVGLLALFAWAPRGQAQDSTRAPAAARTDTIAWTQVTYISGGSVYLEAGTKAGLREGSHALVVRRGATVAELVVAFVSSNRASCTVASGSETIAVGDSVRFLVPRETRAVVAVHADSAPARGAAAASVRRTRSVASRPLRGRFGMRYFITDFSAVPNGSYTQPAIDARVEGQRLGGSPVGLVLDVRAHRTLYSGTGGFAGTSNDLSATRVYQAVVSLDQAAGPTRLAVGRQFSSALSPIGLFDGAALDLRWNHTSTGAFAGTQPDPVSFGMSGDIREYGVYGQLHNSPGSRGVWSFTTGAIGSYVQGQVNREFLYLQSLFVNRVVSFYASQEIDHNRGWKTDAGEKATTPTSTYANLRIALTDGIAISGGVDNRRNVRLYRDFLNPEIVFDDSFRQGMWGGVSLAWTQHFRATFDSRSSSGGTSGRADSWTGSVSLLRLTPLGFGVRLRSTSYSGDIVAGQLQSVALEMQPSGPLRFEINGGSRNDTHPLSGVAATRLTWFGANADIGIGRSVFLSLSTYREASAAERTTQSYAALSYRF